jgi:protein-S-isoprenylcysteine O-methyltransferase Ste14
MELFLTTFFILYMLTAFVWPTYRTYKRTGINPLTFGKTENAHDLIGKWFKFIIFLIPVNIGLFWLGPNWYRFTLPVWYLDHQWVRITGIILCITSLVWTSFAQYQMGESWRIGIDEQNKAPLVKKGLYTISRNPIFLGMLFTLAGVFLCLPNALSLLTFVCGYLLIQIQVRLEEEFLIKNYGEDYRQFMQQTRRWI